MFYMNPRYKELVELITKLNHHYYTLDEPIVSDAEYDRLYDELVQLETENPSWKVSSSPTNYVGGDVSRKFQKKEHTTQLYSLGKAQTSRAT